MCIHIYIHLHKKRQPIPLNKTHQKDLLSPAHSIRAVIRTGYTLNFQYSQKKADSFPQQSSTFLRLL